MRNKAMSNIRRTAVAATVVFSGLLAASAANAAATIVIINGNAAGVGFNDPTAAAPVGGNAGTTLGQQRLIAFQAVANKWGATLTSNVTIQVLATFEPLSCTATSAVLGSAGATSVWRDFPNVPLANTWYSTALANKLAGVQLDPATARIFARASTGISDRPIVCPARRSIWASTTITARSSIWSPC